MKVSAQWLSEWVTTSLAPETLAERLTMAGLEVDSVARVAEPMSGILVARVIVCMRHPDADKLSCCRIDAGQGNVADVVCGAPNVRAGLSVAYAAPGTILPDGKKIEAAVIRGVNSAGMLCSATELMLGDDHSGLIELDDDAPVGVSLQDYLQLDDSVLDIELTPNRGDCLSILGVAREVAALTGTVTRTINIPSLAPTIDDQLPITIEASNGCPRYVGRVIKNVDCAVATPIRIQERLRRAGVRSISAVVDVTNYVMLELGQPMHGFDLDRLDGGICVRNGRLHESLELLDGQTIELDDKTLVIADDQRAVALAGVMGGARSSVKLTSKHVFLESAYFDAITLAGVARRYRLHTDASHRFERGVDFTAQERAIEHATAMIIGICGGEAGPVTVAQSTPSIPTREPIKFRTSEIERLIGIQVGTEQACDYLRAVHCRISESGKDLVVTPPNFRFDLELEADLLEEIARLVGYDNIPATLPRAAMSLVAGTSRHERDERIRQVLLAQGYFEAITYSFIDAESSRIVAPSRTPHELANPITAEMAVMRTSVWPGLIRAAQYNLNRQVDNVRFFELGVIFDKRNNGLEQRHVLSGIALGGVAPAQWGEEVRNVDYYDVKQDLKNIFEMLKIASGEWTPATDAALHPGQSATLEVAGRVIGKVGLLHPRVARHFNLDTSPVVFEVALDEMPEAGMVSYAPISKFPSVKRDISIVVGEEVAAADVLTVVRNAAGERLRDLQLFDEYRGQGIDSDKKSLAIGLIFQAYSSTLIDEEVEETMKRVLLQLHEDFKGTLRN